MPELLQFRAVDTYYGDLHVLKAVDYRIEEGEIVCLLGGNASGKTTTLKTVLGMVVPSQGEVRLDGENVTGAATTDIVAKGISMVPENRRLFGKMTVRENLELGAYQRKDKDGIARTFQNIRLFPNLTVLENVLIGMHARLHTGAVEALLRLPRTRREEQEARDKAMEILAVFGNRLMPRVDHVVSSLSYANRRRVEIARALASRPKLLLLDEPTAGMNPAETLELADQIKSLNRLGLTIVLIEHKLDVVINLAETVVVLDHGEKIAEGSPAEVRRDEEVIRAYLGRSAALA